MSSENPAIAGAKDLADNTKKVLTGYRPTGRIHLGHYFGNLENMVKMQDTYESYFFIVEWHALTTAYEETGRMNQYCEDMVLDWLAAGIDPEKASIYRQSDVPQLAELGVYLSMITPVSWLERVPAYKEMIKDYASRGKDIATLGFLGYPVWQAADIIMVHGELIPVGEDQVPHIELTREVVRKFNNLYGDYFKEPQALLSEARRVPGTDGRKMSKSYGNTIDLADTPDEAWKKLKPMLTDPARQRLTDPGNPDVCPVYDLHKLFSPDDVLETVQENCRGAKWGCIACKEVLHQRLGPFLSEFQEKRAAIVADNPNIGLEVLEAGGAKVRKKADETIYNVRERMGIHLRK